MKTPAALTKEDYPSDLSPEQFDRIKPLLEAARRTTRPLTVDLRAVFNAVLYLLKGACSWRALPHDYPRWSIVYYHFQVWRDHVDKESGQPLLGLVLKKIDFRGAAEGRSGTGSHVAHS